MAHWLLVIPFYFFTALATFLALALVSRILRLKVGANALATAAVIAGRRRWWPSRSSLDWIDLAHLSGRQIARARRRHLRAGRARHAARSRVLPLPVDRELSHF